MIEHAASALQPVTGDMRETRRMPWFGRVALGWSLALLLLALPFETTGGMRLPSLLLTTTELLAGIALALWGLLLLYERRLPAVPGWLVLPAGLFCGLLLLSALLAPQHQFEAVKFALRQTQGMLLALCLAERVRAEGWPLVRHLLGALCLGGLVSASLGLWELTETPLALQFLGQFKNQPSLMGGMLRLSATFAYANIAAMYYEALLPLALAASLGMLRGRWRLGGVAGAALLFAAVILTYSRAALLGCGVMLAAVPLLALRRWGRGPTFWRALGLCVGVAALVVSVLLASPTMRLRLSASDVESWYGAEYWPAPMAPMRPGELRSVGIRVTNTGQATWEADGPRPVMLAYHWLDAESGALISFEGRRTRLPQALAPGETLDLQAQVQAPLQPGRYQLAWDLLLENGGGWFSQKGVQTTRVPVTIEQQGGQPVAPPRPQSVAIEPPSPKRSALWALALRLWWERPLLGIGPDVFRHIYGPYLGLERWDTRVHTNNLYLEVLTGSGLLGFAAFVGLLASLAWRVVRVEDRQSRVVDRPDHPEAENWSLGSERWWWCLVASALGLAGFLIHGALDVFLAFTATYVLFWAWIGVMAGLVRGRGSGVRGRGSGIWDRGQGGDGDDGDDSDGAAVTTKTASGRSLVIARDGGDVRQRERWWQRG